MSYIPNKFGMSALGNTAGTAGLASNNLVLAGGNNVTLSQNTGVSGNTITISAGAGAAFSAGMNNIGNTSGTTGTVSNQLIFAGSNNITLSQSTAAGGNTISISAPNMFNGGVGALGNTVGSTGTVSNQLILAGGNNVTLSQSTGGAGATVTISAGAGTAFKAGMSGGNTTGDAGTVSNQLVFAGGTNITLSQSTAAGGATISIIAPAAASGGGGGGASYPTLLRYQNMDRGTSAVLGVPYNTPFFQRLNQENDLFAGNMTVSSFLMNMSGTASSGASSTQTISAHTISLSIGIYQPHTASNSVLTLLNSASTTFGSGTTMSIYPHYFGNRWLSFGTGQWSGSSLAFAGGQDYVFGVLARSSASSTGLSFIGQSYMNSNQRSGFMGVSTSTGNTTSPHGNYWNAIYSTTTGALPTAISGDQMKRNNATAIFIPHIILNNQYTY